MEPDIRQRFPRRAKQQVSYVSDDAWFPDTTSSNPLFVHMAQLNRESFPFFLYSWADDLLVRALFGSKRDFQKWSDVTPEASSKSAKLDAAPVRQDIRKAAALCHPLTNGLVTGSLHEAVQNVAQSLLTIPTFSRSEVQWLDVLIHLLFRYALMYQPGSPVKHCKVQFGQSIGHGLRARRDLQPGSFIMETCSSMSSDVIFGSGVSIIEGQPKQRGPRGPRAILGPFRFANHNCKANARIYAISQTASYVLVVDEYIRSGEEITVKYGKDGYYKDGCLCFACTGRRGTDLRNPKPANDHPKQTSEAAEDLNLDSNRPRKKVRRGMKGKNRPAKSCPHM